MRELTGRPERHQGDETMQPPDQASSVDRPQHLHGVWSASCQGRGDRTSACRYRSGDPGVHLLRFRDPRTRCRTTPAPAALSPQQQVRTRRVIAYPRAVGHADALSLPEGAYSNA